MTGQSVSIREADDVVLPTTMPAILRLGKSAGLTKVNLGVDFLANDGPPGKEGTHVDFTLAKIGDDLVVPGYAEPRTDVGAVRLTSYVGAATTPNSTHSRTEFRELKANGVDKASWSSTSDRHYVWCRGAIIRLAPGRPHTVIAQIHDAHDDVATIRVEGANVVLDLRGRRSAGDADDLPGAGRDPRMDDRDDPIRGLDDHPLLLGRHGHPEGHAEVRRRLRQLLQVRQLPPVDDRARPPGRAVRARPVRLGGVAHRLPGSGTAECDVVRRLRRRLRLRRRVERRIERCGGRRDADVLRGFRVG